MDGWIVILSIQLELAQELAGTKVFAQFSFDGMEDQAVEPL